MILSKSPQCPIYFFLMPYVSCYLENSDNICILEMHLEVQNW